MRYKTRHNRNVNDKISAAGGVLQSGVSPRPAFATTMPPSGAGLYDEQNDRSPGCSRVLQIVLDVLIEETLATGVICGVDVRSMAINARRVGWSYDEIAQALIGCCCKIAPDCDSAGVWSGERMGPGMLQRPYWFAMSSRRRTQAARRYETALLIIDLALCYLDQDAKEEHDDVSDAQAGIIPARLA